jgi:hypothetical protein
MSSTNASSSSDEIDKEHSIGRIIKIVIRMIHGIFPISAVVVPLSSLPLFFRRPFQLPVV